jgi:hypothetical protein
MSQTNFQSVDPLPPGGPLAPLPHSSARHWGNAAAVPQQPRSDLDTTTWNRGHVYRSSNLKRHTTQFTCRCQAGNDGNGDSDLAPTGSHRQRGGPGSGFPLEPGAKRGLGHPSARTRLAALAGTISALSSPRAGSLPGATGKSLSFAQRRVPTIPGPCVPRQLPVHSGSGLKRALCPGQSPRRPSFRGLATVACHLPLSGPR